MADDAEGVSDLLRSWGRGDVQARDRLVPLVYQELKRRAAAYLRLLGQERVAWQNRAHFFGIAAQMMRRNRRRSRQRETDIEARLSTACVSSSTTKSRPQTDPVDLQLLQLGEALDVLAALDARQAQIVEMRYFAGMSEREVAVALSLSRATVTREWQAAKAAWHSPTTWSSRLSMPPTADS